MTDEVEGVGGDLGRCRQLFGIHGRLCIEDSASLVLDPAVLCFPGSPLKMPLGPPSSAVFIQNAAPGFTSTPGYVEFPASLKTRILITGYDFLDALLPPSRCIQ